MKFITILSLALLTSCATKRDWKQSHYNNANSYFEAKTLCDSGQKQKAKELGYTCLPRDKNGNIITNTSQSNGNVSNIYINGSQAQNGAYNRQPANQMFNAMKMIYEQERSDRLNRICTFNGTCKN